MRHRRVTDKVLEFDKDYIQSLLNPHPETNAGQLQLVKNALHSVIVEELTERQKQVIEMHYFQGMKDIQIARELGLNPSTVMRTRKRAESNIYRTLRFFFGSRSQQGKE